MVLLAGCTAQKVQRGDNVLITYTGKFTNGTIFDTNDIQYKAQFPQKSFTSLPVKVGAGQVISGFDAALVDMKKGELKTVTIKAVDAYGGYNPDDAVKVQKIIVYPIEMVYKRTVSVPIAEIPANLQTNDSVGKNITTKNFIYSIKKINSTSAELFMLKPLMNTFVFDKTMWNSTFVNMTADDMVFRQDIKNNQTYILSEGPYISTTNSTHAIMNTVFEMGQSYRFGSRVARTTSQNDRTITVDFNHPLAGENLVFDITIADIVKTN